MFVSIFFFFYSYWYVYHLCLSIVYFKGYLKFCEFLTFLAAVLKQYCHKPEFKELMGHISSQSVQFFASQALVDIQEVGGQGDELAALTATLRLHRHWSQPIGQRPWVH